jgi:hypothetical protein
MSTDLRAALTELAESAAPELEAVSPARRATLARARARTIRRRRLTARSLGALAVAAAAVGILHVAPTGPVQPAKPPFDGTERFAHLVLERDLLGTTAVEVDGDPVHLVVTAPDPDLQVRFFCSRSASVKLRVSVDGGSSGYVSGCYDTSESSSRSGEDWVHLGLRVGQPTSFTISAVTVGTPSVAELENPTWAFVAVYGTPASGLPSRPAAVPGTTGLRQVAAVTLDADNSETELALPVPRSRTMFYAASCAGPADGLEYMIHAGDLMLTQGSCRFAEPPLQLPLDGVPTQHGDFVARVFLFNNHGEDARERPPASGARIVISFYVRPAG